MKKETKEDIKEISGVDIDSLFEESASKEERKSTNTAFYLMFPSLISAAIAAYYAPLIVSFIAIALAIYQFLLLKSFVQDFYNNK